VRRRRHRADRGHNTDRNVLVEGRHIVATGRAKTLVGLREVFRFGLFLGMLGGWTHMK
jgi:hypothetical protein